MTVPVMDARFGVMDGFGDYRQIISVLNPPIEDAGQKG